MCMLSAVFDYGSRQSEDWWDRRRLDEFKRAIDAAKIFDEKTDQPACEDPTKMKFLKRVELRVKARETAERLKVADVESFVLGAEWAAE